jgi:hypothetical protein
MIEQMKLLHVLNNGQVQIHEGKAVCLVEWAALCLTCELDKDGQELWTFSPIGAADGTALGNGRGFVNAGKFYY